MADLSTKSDPMDLRDERPDYVEDRVGEGNDDGTDRSETAQPSVGSDPQETSTPGIDKPTVTLDPEKVAQAEREGKGYAADA